jgi:hypothetical protein
VYVHFLYYCDALGKHGLFRVPHLPADTPSHAMNAELALLLGAVAMLGDFIVAWLAQAAEFVVGNDFPSIAAAALLTPTVDAVQRWTQRIVGFVRMDHFHVRHVFSCSRNQTVASRSCQIPVRPAFAFPAKQHLREQDLLILRTPRLNRCFP